MEERIYVDVDVYIQDLNNFRSLIYNMLLVDRSNDAMPYIT